MLVADQITDHQSRCTSHLLRLYALTCDESGTAVSRHALDEVRDATNAIIAEAEAAGRAALATMAGDQHALHAELFLCVRLARLAEAADNAISAASRADAPVLRRSLRQFDTLTSAIWTVQHSVHGQS
jgi:hypothetical protein